MIWWTNDLGKPNLVTFITSVVSKQTNVTVSSLIRTAFRTITLKQIPDSTGKSFTLNLNGYDLFIRGGNYIPP